MSKKKYNYDPLFYVSACLMVAVPDLYQFSVSVPVSDTPLAHVFIHTKGYLRFCLNEHSTFMGGCGG